MNDLTELERSLLAAARRGFSPSPEVGARVRGRALSVLAAGTVVAYPRQSLLMRAKNRALDALENRSGWARFLLGVLALSGVGMGGYALGVRAGRAEAQAGRAAIQVPNALPAPPLAVVVPAPGPEHLAADAERRSQPRHPTPAPTPEHAVRAAASAELANDPEEELRALRHIEHVLREHNPRLAAALLDELDRSVPRGKLVEERSAARTIATCELDDAASVANQRAAEFAARYAGSVYLPRVNQACAVGDAPAERIDRAPETNQE